MKVTFNYYLKNDESQETFDDGSLELELTDKGAIREAVAFSEKNNSENAEVFFKSLLNYGWGEPGNGFLYDEAFEGFSSVGWYTLGWFHVVVFITSIEINGNLIEIDEETQDQYGIQMVRSDPEDLFMYFFNL